MRRLRITVRMTVSVTALTLVVGMTSIARAADPAAQQDPIAATSALGDKGRTGPDGWVSAPITRDAAPAAKPTAANSDANLNSQPGPNTGKTLAPGDDPGTPLPTEANGPGAMDNAKVRKP